MKIFAPCIHAEPQADSQLHGICVFCYRDRLGKSAKQRDELVSLLKLYGAHIRRCRWGEVHGGTVQGCTCGFRDAVKRIEEGASDEQVHR